MKKQAVVLIHGIGEQRPMDTIRGFVDALLPINPRFNLKFWSKPDTLLDSFELRRLRGAMEPPTDFFEFYWAYQAEGTRLMHVWQWTKRLMIRRPGRVPAHLKPVWWLLVVLSVLVVGLFVFSGFGIRSGWLITAGGSFAGAVVAAYMQYLLLAYLGDAARYLSPTPTNIRLRQSIRSDGVKLLKALHESGKYERIILVGHSLGSVIGYDLLRYVWSQYCDEYRPIDAEQPALQAAEDAGERLYPTQSSAALDAYQQCQTNLFKELKAASNKWLVTDFITAGSPLAHAAILMADDMNELQRKQAEREFPICPPVTEFIEGRLRYSYVVREKRGDTAIQFFKPHHAAHFAFTRWTNLYFPAAWGLFGDLIAGPLSGVFGPGIRDITVSSAAWGGIKQRTPWIHTCYWSATAGDRAAVEALIIALRLT